MAVRELALMAWLSRLSNLEAMNGASKRVTYCLASFFNTLLRWYEDPEVSTSF